MLGEVSIIIVNWNAGYQLADAVVSIAKFHTSLVSSVIIVDNASTDDSLAQVNAIENLPFTLDIVRNLTNRGFGAACNQGASLATGDYLLFLNPDTRLFEDSLYKPYQFMQDQKNKDVGIVGIQLLDEQNRIARSCARFPKLLAFATNLIGLDRVLPKLGMAMVEWDHKQTREVDQVIGAFFFVRRNVFKLLRGFDERFFVYFEEVDFSFRAQSLGYRSIFFADAQAFHAGGGTSRQVKALRLFYSLRSRLLYGLKHFSLFQAYILIIITLGPELVTRSIFSLFSSGSDGVRNTLQAYGMLWRNLRFILKRHQ
jgi:GT2 family glycosyltransferase